MEGSRQDQEQRETEAHRRMSASCHHETLLARIKIPVNEYVCDDCKLKLVLVVPQYGLMTPEEFEQFKRVQAVQIQNAKRRKSTGLVTPGEHRQEQAQAKKTKEEKR